MLFQTLVSKSSTDFSVLLKLLPGRKNFPFCDA